MKKNHFAIIGFWQFSFFAFFVLFGMILHVYAQETAIEEGVERIKQEELSKTNASPDKSSPIMLNVVGGDARINGLTVGRGFGSNIENVAFGLLALDKNTGYYNTAIGSNALLNNTTGITNTALGAWALRDNTTGYQNVAIGGSALRYNISGRSNTAVGRRALYLNTTGFSNVAIGESALNSNTERSNLVAVGDSALFHNGLDGTNINQAMRNVAIGSKALYLNTKGSYNTAIGYQALYSNTSGVDNTASGDQALYSNTIGYDNTASGLWALFSNTTGQHNTANGVVALYSNTAGNINSAFGSQALRNLDTGSNNTAVGFSAGAFRSSISQGTFIGSNAYPSNNGLFNVTGIGYNARPSQNNQVHIGNSSVTSIQGNVGFTTFSDGSYKTNLEEDVAGLEFILRLRPVSYNLDVHKLAADLGEDITQDKEGNKGLSPPDEITLKSRDEKAAIHYTGFIAQEVEATVNELGVAFSGVDAPTNKDSHYGLRYADFVVPLVKAVQEQQAQIELLEPAAVEALQQELQELKEENANIQQTLFGAITENFQMQQNLQEVNEVNAEIQNQLEHIKAENEQIKDQLDQILALLSAQGIDLAGVSTGDPSRAGAGRSGRDMGTGTARLEQNTPNPFHENTVVRYYVPENAGKAQIVITDLQGNRLHAIDLGGSGHGQVTIRGGSLPSGTYVYSLIINGLLVDSKRMVLVM